MEKQLARLILDLGEPQPHWTPAEHWEYTRTLALLVIAQGLLSINESLPAAGRGF